MSSLLWYEDINREIFKRINILLSRVGVLQEGIVILCFAFIVEVQLELCPEMDSLLRFSDSKDIIASIYITFFAWIISVTSVESFLRAVSMDYEWVKMLARKYFSAVFPSSVFCTSSGTLILNKSLTSWSVHLVERPAVSYYSTTCQTTRLFWDNMHPYPSIQA